MRITPALRVFSVNVILLIVLLALGEMMLQFGGINTIHENDKNSPNWRRYKN